MQPFFTQSERSRVFLVYVIAAILVDFNKRFLVGDRSSLLLCQSAWPPRLYYFIPLGMNANEE
jgi:hypothetical protein